MYSMEHCSVAAAICVASNYENHSHCDAKSQPGDTVLRSCGPAIAMTLRGIAFLALHCTHAGGGWLPIEAPDPRARSLKALMAVAIKHTEDRVVATLLRRPPS